MTKIVLVVVVVVVMGTPINKRNKIIILQRIFRNINKNKFSKNQKMKSIIKRKFNTNLSRKMKKTIKVNINNMKILQEMKIMIVAAVLLPSNMR